MADRGQEEGGVEGGSRAVNVDEVEEVATEGRERARNKRNNTKRTGTANTAEDGHERTWENVMEGAAMVWAKRSESEGGYRVSVGGWRAANGWEGKQHLK
jgi:hypothetical protein